MDESTILRRIVEKIRKVSDPERIVLFGSRARGSQTNRSDFDILVVDESAEPRFKRPAPIYTQLADLPIEVEVVVYTPEEIDDWRAVPRAFVTTAIREGKVLYERKS